MQGKRTLKTAITTTLVFAIGLLSGVGLNTIVKANVVPDWVYSVNNTTPDANGNINVDEVNDHNVSSDVPSNTNFSQYSANTMDLSNIETTMSGLTATADKVASGYTFIGSGGLLDVGSSDAGSTIQLKYLYKEGDECTSVTGGWNNASRANLGAASDINAGLMRKNSNNLEFGDSSTGAYQYGGFTTAQAINFEDYTFLLLDVEAATTASSSASDSGVFLVHCLSHAMWLYKRTNFAMNRGIVLIDLKNIHTRDSGGVNYNYVNNNASWTLTIGRFAGVGPSVTATAKVYNIALGKVVNWPE